MARQKYVIRGGEREAIRQRLAGREGLRGLQTLAVAAPEDVHRDRELVAAHVGLPGHLRRINVDHLHDPVGVRPARRRDQVRDRLAADLHRHRQDVRLEDRDVRARGRLALVRDEPLPPSLAVIEAARDDRARMVRHRLRRIGNVFLEHGSGPVARHRRGEAQLAAGGEIERRRLHRASARAAGRPRLQPPPRVRAGFERHDGRDARGRRPVLEVLIEERPQNLPAERERGITFEPDRAEGAAVPDLLAVVPRAHHEEHLVVTGVLGLDGLVHGGRAVDVFLVPQTVDEHHGHLQRLRRQDAVDRLVAPKGVVGGMLEDLLPEAELLHPPPAAQLPGRSRLEERVVVVEVAREPLGVALPRGLLVVNVGQIPALAERAVVEPVVAHPTVDHRVHRHRHLERGMRVHERHQRQEAVVRDPEDADLPVRLRHVLHEPVDRVVRVGRVVHGRRVLRPVQRPVHHVVALGAVLAAHVLHDADVAALDDRLDRVVVAVEARAEVRALVLGRELVGVVGRPREENRHALRPVRNEDHRVQLHAVAHRDLDLAPGVLVTVRRGHELPGRLAREPGVLSRGRGRRFRRLRQLRGGQRKARGGCANASDRLHERNHV